MSGVNYGTYTMVDLLNAQFYAQTQVNKLKCTDPDIINKVCNSDKSPKYPGGGTCISWKDDINQRSFPAPKNYYLKQCSLDSDCEMGKCEMGKCICTSSSQCKGLDCVPDPSNSPNLVCGYAPPDIASGHCVFNNKQACEAQGEVPYTCTDSSCAMKTDSKFPYTEWHVDENGDGKCVLGNFALKQWCENPVSRCKDGDDECLKTANVPPFIYDSNKSLCYMSHDYCDSYGMEYNKGGCNGDSDCGVGNICRQEANGKYCSGIDSDCVQTTGDKVGKFFMGNTLFYMFKKDKFNPKDCGPGSENYTETRRQIIGKDFFGTDTHLYLIRENDEETISPLHSEIGKRYPHLVRDGKIIIKVSDIGNDKNLKRLYLTMHSKKWLKDLLLANYKRKFNSK